MRAVPVRRPNRVDLDRSVNESLQDFESHYPGLTRHFAAGDAEALVEVLVPTRVSAGERWIRRGSVSDTMYLVDGGLLSISIGE